MSSSKYPLPSAAHPLLHTVLDDWRHRAGVLSALPDAPVQPERLPRPLRSRWPWLSRRLGIFRLSTAWWAFPAFDPASDPAEPCATGMRYDVPAGPHPSPPPGPCRIRA